MGYSSSVYLVQGFSCWLMISLCLEAPGSAQLKLVGGPMPFTIGHLRFCPVEECANRRAGAACGRLSPLVGKSFSESLLSQCKGDSAAMATLRSALSRFGISVAAHVSTAVTLNVFAEHFSSGRLRICQPAATTITPVKGDPATTTGSNQASPASSQVTTSQNTTTASDAAKPFPMADRSQKAQAASSTATTDASSFPSDVHLVALAQVLKQASQAGVPFCEECAKAQARG